MSQCWSTIQCYLTPLKALVRLGRGNPLEPVHHKKAPLFVPSFKAQKLSPQPIACYQPFSASLVTFGNSSYRVAQWLVILGPVRWMMVNTNHTVTFCRLGSICNFAQKQRHTACTTPGSHIMRKFWLSSTLHYRSYAWEGRCSEETINAKLLRRPGIHKGRANKHLTAARQPYISI